MRFRAFTNGRTERGRGESGEGKPPPVSARAREARQPRSQVAHQMALKPKPALLAKRLEAARQRLTTTAKADLAAATRSAHAAPPPPPPPPAKAKAAPHKHAKAPTPEPTPQAAPKAKKGRAADGRAVGQATAMQIAQTLRQAATNQEMAALVSDEQLAAVWTSIVDGAGKMGPAGAADRASLARALGLPLHQMVAGRGAKNAGPEIAGRLETALNRSRSRVPVTDDAAEDETPMETAA